MKKVIGSFFLIINFKTLIVTVLSVISSYVCFHFNLTAKFPDMLVGVAIVFPVVFSIGSAYTRRETALQRWADFKGHAIAIFYATRDWTSTGEQELPVRFKKLLSEMLHLMQNMFRDKSQSSWDEHEKQMYRLFSQLSRLTMEFRNHGLQSGEVSRVSQYVSKIIIAFDNMKIIHNYRTPVTLRTYSKVFIYLFPVLYGPYFASTFHEYNAHLEYVMPVLYSFILVSLDNIQDHLENPFDEVGEDDVRFETAETMDLLH